MIGLGRTHRKMLLDQAVREVQPWPLRVHTVGDVSHLLPAEGWPTETQIWLVRHRFSELLGYD